MLNNIVGVLGVGGGVATNFDSIATVTVGAGGTSTVTFSSISGSYKHLQIRALAGNNNAAAGVGSLYIEFNSDTANNYSWHRVYGNGASASVNATASTSKIDGGLVSMAGATNPFAGSIIDILDYTSTTKAKTVRTLTGSDRNGGGTVALYSGGWYKNTSSVYEAITNIVLTTDAGNSFTQYSHFALYGCK